jgi:hypothetical protein
MKDDEPAIPGREPEASNAANKEQEKRGAGLRIWLE